MALSNVHAIRQVVVDVLVLLAVGLCVLISAKLAFPAQRGFFCGDVSIHYPYRNSTLPSLAVGAVCLFLPMTVMVIVELVRRSKARPSKYLSGGIRVGKFNLHPILLELVHLVGVFLFGAGCSQLATDIGKFSIGRLRPHFIDVCNPDLELLCGPNVPSTKYIEDFECRGTDQYRLKDARLSFPSGHASFSAYTMFYLAIYLQARMTWRGSKLLRPGLQALVLSFFWFTTLSRVSDYKHHWSDVLAGAILGLTVASIIAKYVSHLFDEITAVEDKSEGTKMDSVSLPNGYKSDSECSPIKSTLCDNIA